MQMFGLNVGPTAEEPEDRAEISHFSKAPQVAPTCSKDHAPMLEKPRSFYRFAQKPRIATLDLLSAPARKLIPSLPPHYAGLLVLKLAHNFQF